METNENLITQPKSYNPETIKPGQIWQEKGGEHETYTVTEVGTHGAIVEGTSAAVSFQFFAYCTLIQDVA
jgi:hypothetical protein